jgi:hypothetical protein
MSRRKSWIVREVERDATFRRKQLRAEARDLERNRKLAVKEQVKAAAAQEVAIDEDRRDHLVSLHKNCGSSWDWLLVSNQPPPEAPVAATTYEDSAKAQLEAFKPSFWDKLFGGEKRKRAELEQRLDRARGADAATHGAAVEEHSKRVERYTWELEVARGILGGDLASYSEALDGIAPFEELLDERIAVSPQALLNDLVVLQCLVDRTVIPDEEKKLTTGGKVSVKPLAAGAKWALHEQFVASSALRVAREALAVLPVPRVVVNVKENGINRADGQPAVLTLLGISAERHTLDRIRFETVDPVAAVERLPNRINFKRGTGFEPVEPITEHDKFATMSRA